MTTETAGALDALFRPRSIAVIGASDDPRKIGGRPIRYMLEAKSDVKVYPVNPTRPEVQGLTAYPTATASPSRSIRPSSPCPPAMPRPPWPMPAPPGSALS